MSDITRDKQKKTKPRHQVPGAGKAGKTKTMDSPAPRTCLGLSPPPAPSRSTKKQVCIDLLKRRKGASLKELQEATGWQAHTVRGFLSGTVKKSLGFDITSKQVGNRGRVYQVSLDR